VSIEDDELDEAVQAGVITQADVDKLQNFIAARRLSRLHEAGQEDERFRFMRGFNDFFFAIGILLLCAAMAFFSGLQAIPSLVAAALVWGLSELLVRRMRLVLPGILLSLFFLFFVFAAVPVEYFLTMTPVGQLASPMDAFTKTLQLDYKPVLLARSLVAMAACGLYYWRFRLPFSLATLACGAVVAALAIVQMAIGTLSEYGLYAALLACGLAVFAAAMAFDTSDRLRVTRRSDCAFWLHLLAAPLIVHSLVSFVIPDMAMLDTRTATVIVAMVAFLALIAIAVDRRALLVSTLAYVGVVIAFALTATGSSMLAGQTQGPIVFFITLFVLGLFVIVLGLGWLPLRRVVLSALPSTITSRLTPLPARA
jgi:hypothetical protein